MIEKNGVKLFGYFKGMVYTRYKDKDLEEDFEKYQWRQPNEKYRK